MGRCGKWMEVSRHRPCGKCGKKRFCMWAEDGGEWCEFVNDGSAHIYTTSDGRECYIYGYSHSAGYVPAEYTPRPLGAPRARPADLDRVYRALLERSFLSDQHREALRGRGLSDDQIDRRGYRTQPLRGRSELAKYLADSFGDDLCARVPGLFVREEAGRSWWSLSAPPGLLIPVRDEAGRVLALLVRRDQVEDDGPRYLYASSSKHGGPSAGMVCHTPLFTGSTDTVRYTGGVLKADVATDLSGVLTLGIPGVSAHALVLPNLKELNARQVRCAFDADAIRNPHVARALVASMDRLRQEGWSPELELWSESDGKGIDDVLRGGGPIQIIAAKEAPKRAVAILQEAQQSVPTSGGVEAPAASKPVVPVEEPEEEWVPPATRVQVKPFPLEVLPRFLRCFLATAAESLPAPVDFVALPLLIAAGTAIGNSRVLQVKQGWREGPRIYGAVVGNTGSRKTEALKRAIRPLLRLHKRYLEDYQAERKQYEEEEKPRYECLQAKYKADQKKPNPLFASEPPPAPVEPEQRQVTTSDSTIEGMVSLLRVQTRAVLFYRDELSGWVGSMDAYRGGKGQDRQYWLSLWSGESILVNRKGQEPVYIPRPFVNVAGCIPPDILIDLVETEGQTRDDGFIDRILFAYPDPHPGGWRDLEFPAELERAYQEVIERLWSLEPVQTEDGEEPRVIPFTREARETFVRWYDAHEADKREVPDRLSGPWSKMHGYGARLALILQLLRWACDGESAEAVDELSVLGAAALIDYFKSAAWKVYVRLESSPEDLLAGRILDWMERHGKQAVSARELAQSRLVKDSEAAKQILRFMGKRGHGVYTVGEKKSVRFELRRPPSAPSVASVDQV